MKDLLFLCHRIPYPPNKGDKIRSFNLLKHLARDYRVHLGTFIDDVHDFRYVDDVQAMCAETCFLKLNPATARLRSLSGLLSGKALTLPYYSDDRLHRWVNGLLRRHAVDCVFVYSSAMAQYALGPAAVKTRRVIDFVDVDSDKWAQYAKRHRWPASWIYRRESARLLAFDRAVAAQFDASLFVSAHEAELFRQLAPEAADRVGFMNNGVDIEYFTPQGVYHNPYRPAERVLVFTGAMDYWANVDAVCWFAREVFPLLRSRDARLHFYIVGARPMRRVLDLQAIEGVQVTSAVKDIRPYLAHAAVAVAPMRIARGIQNKVLEAMAMARPVVASDQAIEGIVADIGSELLAADGAHAFAEQVARLLEQPELAGTIGRAARTRIERDYAWQRQLGALEQLLEGGRPTPAHNAPGTRVPDAVPNR